MRVISRRLLPHTVAWERYAGNFGDGPMYDPAVDLPARVDRTQRLVEDSLGATVVAGGAIYLQPGRDFGTSDRFRIDGEAVTVTRIASHTGRRDPSYVEVAIQ